MRRAGTLCLYEELSQVARGLLCVHGHTRTHISCSQTLTLMFSHKLAHTYSPAPCPPLHAHTMHTHSCTQTHCLFLLSCSHTCLLTHAHSPLSSPHTYTFTIACPLTLARGLTCCSHSCSHTHAYLLACWPASPMRTPSHTHSVLLGCLCQRRALPAGGCLGTGFVTAARCPQHPPLAHPTPYLRFSLLCSKD